MKKTYSRTSRPLVLLQENLPEEYLNACRLCLCQSDNLSNIFAKNNILPTSTKIRFCVGLEISEDDGLPALMCEKCFNHVIEFYAFKKLCIATDTKLKQYMRSTKQNLIGHTCDNEIMAEKNKQHPATSVKPVPMKLFATWEVDRTPPNCIPRLCSLTLTRLIILNTLGSDLVSVVIAVKIQGSKRTLRSNELVLPPNGLLDTELQLNFSLQYPHFLKRDGNKLHVMLQRRKRYKNRTILGYKTLAEGIINMSQVLQRQMDLDLDLLTDGKESKTHSNIARVTVNSLSSQPVDHEGSMKGGQSGRGDYSDEEEEFSSVDEGSDSEPMLEDQERRGCKSSMPPDTARQRNLKQRFKALLKRFRVNEDLQGLDTDREAISSKLSGGEMDPADIEDLFEELEDLSDSGPEMDTMSISSTPKPSLRPFFSSSRSLLHEALNIPGKLMKNT